MTSTSEKKKVSKIPEKYYRMMAFAHWFMTSSDSCAMLDIETMQGNLHFFDTNENIIQFYDGMEANMNVHVAAFKEFQRDKKSMQKRQSKRQVVVNVQPSTPEDFEAKRRNT